MLLNLAEETNDIDESNEICDISDELYRINENQESAGIYAQILLQSAKSAEYIDSVIHKQVMLNSMRLQHDTTVIQNCYIQSYVEYIRVASDMGLVYSYIDKIEQYWESSKEAEQDEDSIYAIANTCVSAYYHTIKKVTEFDELMVLLKKAMSIAETYDMFDNTLMISMAYDVAQKTKSDEAKNVLKDCYYIYRESYNTLMLFDEKNKNYLNYSPYLLQYQNDQPETIYHYTDLFALKSIVEKNTFWATNHRFLNDTEEKKYISSVLRQLKDRDESCDISHLYDEVSDYVMNSAASINRNTRCNGRYSSDAYIISFSTNKDSLTLWSGYAKKSGVNLGIDSKKLRRDTLLDQYGYNDYVLGGRVIYINANDPEDANIKYFHQLIHEIIDDCGKRNIDPSVRDLIITSHLIYFSNFIKADSMKAEEEYRVVYFPDMSDSKIKIRVKDELLIPYYEYADEIREAIKSITVAPQNKNDLTLEGIQYLLNSYGIESKIPSNDEDEVVDQVAITRSKITLRY